MTDQTQMPAPRPRRSFRRSALVIALLTGTALGGYAAGHAGFAATPAGPVNPPGAAPLANVPDFANLVSHVRPAVVSITTHLKVSDTADMSGPGPQLPFPFNQPPFSMMQPQQQPQAIEARGSGFIINADGIIVTNNHVVKGAKSVEVTLSDGTKLPAHIVGRDPRTDIAVLKIDAGHKLPFIELGNSAQARPGEWVVAMGNPFGLGGTVTAGIISAEGRDIGDGPYDKFIQIDAPINEGNSGGPLFTQNGKVIGMNTAILSPSGGSVGIGFAIPSDMIKTVVAQLQAHGHVTRGYIGVEAQPVSQTMAKALHLSGNGGALIAGVQPGTPAEKAGLLPGDVIRSVNGETVKDPRELAVDVAAVKPGDTAKIEYLRDGAAHTVDIHVAQLPEHIATANSATHEHGRIGLALAPITPQLRGQLGLPRDASGAVVRGVQPNSPADMAGIQQGDVIVGVGTEAVHSPGEAASAIAKAESGPNHAVALRILRNGQPAFVAIELGNAPKQG
ncbi:MAG: Do family serine endopeptidase [Rhodospirillales bacterium]|nr:Do family serine endopeptidase [Rhodospirillales bacterium]